MHRALFRTHAGWVSRPHEPSPTVALQKFQAQAEYDYVPSDDLTNTTASGARRAFGRSGGLESFDVEDPIGGPVGRGAECSFSAFSASAKSAARRNNSIRWGNGALISGGPLPGSTGKARAAVTSLLQF